jgi:ribosome recycling factor
MAYDFTNLKQHIKENEEWLTRELAGVRTGRATPTLLDGVKPEAYGAQMPLSQVANISVEDARSLRIIPWDMTLAKEIERAITEADLGVGVSTDSQGLRVSFPELTGERRVQLSKLAGDKTEQARIALRGHRTDALKQLDDAKKQGGMGDDEHLRLKEEVQKLIDAGNEKLAQLLAKKEEEIAL